MEKKEEQRLMSKRTVIFDFDGVIHSYTSGWKGIDVIPDEPVSGIREVIDELRNEHGYEVVVVSTRCAETCGIAAIHEWLNKHGIAVDRVQAEKPPALVVVDDRCICFDGATRGLVEKIMNFKPYREAAKTMLDVETLAKELHEAGRKAVEAGATVAQEHHKDKVFPFIEWDDLTEHAREGLRIQARHLLGKFRIERK